MCEGLNYWPRILVPPGSRWLFWLGTKWHHRFVDWCFTDDMYTWRSQRCLRISFFVERWGVIVKHKGLLKQYLVSLRWLWPLNKVKAFPTYQGEAFRIVKHFLVFCNVCDIYVWNQSDDWSHIAQLPQCKQAMSTGVKSVLSHPEPDLDEFSLALLRTRASVSSSTLMIMPTFQLHDEDQRQHT